MCSKLMASGKNIYTRTALAETYLHLRVKVTKTDGTALTNADNVAPSNLFAQTLFSQVDVSLNGNIIK